MIKSITLVIILMMFLVWLSIFMSRRIKKESGIGESENELCSDGKYLKSEMILRSEFVEDMDKHIDNILSGSARKILLIHEGKVDAVVISPAEYEKLYAKMKYYERHLPTDNKGDERKL